MLRLSRIRGYFAVLLLLLTAGLAPAFAQSKRALIIGNGNYEQLSPLEGVPQRDAVGYAEVFGDAIGFDEVIVRADITQADFLATLGDFIDSIEPGDTVAFVFSGHGWSDGSENYLAFVDAPLTGTESSRKLHTVALGQTVLDLIQSRSPGAVIAIVDACRNNPFRDQTKSLPKGLGPLQEREGVLVAFAAGQGQTALASLPGDRANSYSLFTRHLLPRLADAHRPLSRIFEDVRKLVQQDADLVPHWQRPAVYSELPLDWCLDGDCQGALSEEGALWLTAAAGAGTPEACSIYADYMTRYPQGAYYAAASRLASLPPCAAEPSNSVRTEVAALYVPETRPNPTGWQRPQTGRYVAFNAAIGDIWDKDTSIVTEEDRVISGGGMISLPEEILDPDPLPAGQYQKVCAQTDAVVYFDYDRSDLNAASVATLQEIAGGASGCAVSSVIISGHDDGTLVNDDGSTISAPMSLRVSGRRADAVAAFLMAEGVPAERILTHAYGATRPASPGGAAAFNRRVEVTILFDTDATR
ncbi:caspase family protein [Hyphomonas sp. WL0036]|uniref:caspase family protein n=1 Tax=Hyphomonas sediminis TaxID=2866160 RepID=UPI001C81ADEF|nr:caspase family protein [Hyphomonas sediminis]MBY9067271.1 caspase family protein [Hyphomonas sediminis]